MMGSYRYESASAERKTISRKPVRRISTFKTGSDHYTQISDVKPNYQRNSLKPPLRQSAINTDPMRDKFRRISCSAPTSEKARIIAYGIKRHIIETKEQVKRSPNFVKRTHSKIVYLHNYNCRVAQVCSMYPLDDDLKELLVKYIELEMSILKNPEYNTDVYRLTLEMRLLTLLSSIYSKYCFYIKGRFSPNDTWQLILDLFEEVPYDVHKFFEDIRQKVIKKIDFGPELAHPNTVQTQLTCYRELDGSVKVEIDLENDPLLRCCQAFNIVPEMPARITLTDRLVYSPVDRPSLECGEVVISDDELTDTGQLQDTDIKREFDMFLPNLTERLKSLKQNAMLEDKKPEIIDLCDDKQTQQRNYSGMTKTNKIITKTNLRRNTVIDLLDSDDEDSARNTAVHLSVDKSPAVSRKCDKSVNSVINFSDDRCRNENVISDLSRTVPERLSDISISDSARDGRDNSTCRTQDETEILRQIRELKLLSGSDEVIIKMVNNKLVITPKDNFNTSDVNITKNQTISSDKTLDIPSSPVEYKPVNRDIQLTVIDLCAESTAHQQQLVDEQENNDSINDRLMNNKDEDVSNSMTNSTVESKPVNKYIRPVVGHLSLEAPSHQQQVIDELDDKYSRGDRLINNEERDISNSKIYLVIASKPVSKDIRLTVGNLSTEPSSHQQQFFKLKHNDSRDNTLNNKDGDISNSKTSSAIASKPVSKGINPTVGNLSTEPSSHQQQCVKLKDNDSRDNILNNRDISNSKNLTEESRPINKDIASTVGNLSTEPLSNQQQFIEELEDSHSRDDRLSNKETDISNLKTNSAVEPKAINKDYTHHQQQFVEELEDNDRLTNNEGDISQSKSNSIAESKPVNKDTQLTIVNPLTESSSLGQQFVEKLEDTYSVEDRISHYEGRDISNSRTNLSVESKPASKDVQPTVVDLHIESLLDQEQLVNELEESTSIDNRLKTVEDCIPVDVAVSPTINTVHYLDNKVSTIEEIDNTFNLGTDVEESISNDTNSADRHIKTVIATSEHSETIDTGSLSRHTKTVVIYKSPINSDAIWASSESFKSVYETEFEQEMQQTTNVSNSLQHSTEVADTILFMDQKDSLLQSKECTKEASFDNAGKTHVSENAGTIFQSESLKTLSDITPCNVEHMKSGLIDMEIENLEIDESILLDDDESEVDTNNIDEEKLLTEESYHKSVKTEDDVDDSARFDKDSVFIVQQKIEFTLSEKEPPVTHPDSFSQEPRKETRNGEDKINTQTTDISSVVSIRPCSNEAAVTKDSGIEPENRKSLKPAIETVLNQTDESVLASKNFDGVLIHSEVNPSTNTEKSIQILKEASSACVNKEKIEFSDNTEVDQIDVQLKKTLENATDVSFDNVKLQRPEEVLQYNQLPSQDVKLSNEPTEAQSKDADTEKLLNEDKPTIAISVHVEKSKNDPNEVTEVCQKVFKTKRRNTEEIKNDGNPVSIQNFEKLFQNEALLCNDAKISPEIMTVENIQTPSVDSQTRETSETGHHLTSSVTDLQKEKELPNKNQFLCENSGERVENVSKDKETVESSVESTESNSGDIKIMSEKQVQIGTFDVPKSTGASKKVKLPIEPTHICLQDVQVEDKEDTGMQKNIEIPLDTTESPVESNEVQSHIKQTYLSAEQKKQDVSNSISQSDVSNCKIDNDNTIEPPNTCLNDVQIEDKEDQGVQKNKEVLVDVAESPVKPNEVQSQIEPTDLSAEQEKQDVTNSISHSDLNDCKIDNDNTIGAKVSLVGLQKPLDASGNTQHNVLGPVNLKINKHVSNVAKNESVPKAASVFENSEILSITHDNEKQEFEIACVDSPVYLEEYFVDNTVEISTCEYYESCIETELMNCNENKTTVLDQQPSVSDEHNKTTNKNSFTDDSSGTCTAKEAEHPKIKNVNILEIETHVTKPEAVSFKQDISKNLTIDQNVHKSTEKQIDQDLGKVSDEVSRNLTVLQDLESEKSSVTETVMYSEDFSVKGEVVKDSTNIISDTAVSDTDRPIIEEILEQMIHTIEVAEENHKKIKGSVVLKSAADDIPVKEIVVKTAFSENFDISSEDGKCVTVEKQEYPEQSNVKDGRSLNTEKPEKGEDKTSFSDTVSLSSSSALEKNMETAPVDTVQNTNERELDEIEKEAAEIQNFRLIKDDEVVQYIPTAVKLTQQQLQILASEETKGREDPRPFLNIVKETTRSSIGDVLNLSNVKKDINDTKSKNTRMTCNEAALNLSCARDDDDDDGKNTTSKTINDVQPLNLATNNNIGEKASGNGFYNKITSGSSRKDGGVQESEGTQNRQLENYGSKDQRSIKNLHKVELKPSDIPSAEKIASYLPKNGKKMENSSVVLYNPDADPLQDLRQSLSKFGTVVIPKTNNQDLHLLAETALKRESINSDIVDPGSDSEGLLLIDETCVSPEYPEIQSEVVLGPSESYLGPNNFVLQIQNSFQTLLGKSNSKRKKSPKSLKNSITLYKGDGNETVLPNRKLIPDLIQNEFLHLSDFPRTISKSARRRPNILKRKSNNILATTDKKSYLQPKLIILPDELKVPRTKTKAEKKQMPSLELSRLSLPSDSDDDIPLAQRVKSRSPSPKKTKSRYGTTDIVVARPRKNEISTVEEKGVVKKTRGKSGDRLKTVHVESIPCFEDAAVKPLKSRTLLKKQEVPNGEPQGKRTRHKSSEINTEKLAPVLKAPRKPSENFVANPDVVDVYLRSNSQHSLEELDRKDDDDTIKTYRSKLRPRSCSGSDFVVDNSGLPVVDPVSQIIEPIGLYVEVKSTDLSAKELPKRLLSSGKVRHRSATMGDDDLVDVVENNQVLDKISIFTPKPEDIIINEDIAPYVSKLRRKSAHENSIEPASLIDSGSINIESDSKGVKKVRSGSPRAKKSTKSTNDPFNEEVVPIVRASAGRSRGRGRGRGRPISSQEKVASLSNKTKKAKKHERNLPLRPGVSVNQLTNNIVATDVDTADKTASEILISPRKLVKKPNLKLDLNQTTKPSSSKAVVTSHTPTQLKENFHSPPLTSVPSATTPKERYKREFKAQIESAKIDITTKNSEPIPKEEKELSKDQKNEPQLNTQENLLLEKSSNTQSEVKDVKKVIHPKLRRKSLFSNCKNTVEPTTEKLIKLLQIDPTKLMDESDKGEQNKNDNISEETSNSTHTNIELYVDNSKENHTQPAELKLTENQQPSFSTIKETHRQTMDDTGKITDQSNNKSASFMAVNLIEECLNKSVQEQENVKDMPPVENSSEAKSLEVMESVRVSDSCEEIASKASKLQENESDAKNTALSELTNCSTPMLSEGSGTNNCTQEISSKSEELLDSSEKNIDTSQEDSMLDDIPLSELKTITNSKKTVESLDVKCVPVSTNAPAFHNTCETKNVKDDDQEVKVILKLDRNLLQDIPIIENIIVDSSHNVAQETCLDPELKLESEEETVKDMCTVGKQSITVLDEENIKIESNQEFEHQQKEVEVLRSTDKSLTLFSSEQKSEDQLPEALVTDVGTSDDQSVKISEQTAIETSILLHNVKNEQKDIETNDKTPFLNQENDKPSIPTPTSLVVEKVEENQQQETSVEVILRIGDQSAVFSDKDVVASALRPPCVEPQLEDRHQASNDQSTTSSENPELQILKDQPNEDTIKTTSTVDRPFANILTKDTPVLVEESNINKTNDSNDFDLVSIAQEAAKHAYENFEEQGTYFDDSGSVVREDIHISIGSEIEVTDTFTGDKEKEQSEIQDKLLHLLHDNLKSESFEMSDEQEKQIKKARAAGFDDCVESSGLSKNKRDKTFSNSSVDQSVSTKVDLNKNLSHDKAGESSKSVKSLQNNLTIGDDSDSEVEMKKKYLDRSRRKERDVKLEEHKKTRLEKTKFVVNADKKKSSKEKFRSMVVRDDKHRNERRSSMHSRSEEDDRSSSRKSRSESSSSINSTNSSLPKSLVNIGKNRREDKNKGSYSKSATSSSDRENYKDRRNSFNSRKGSCDKSADITGKDKHQKDPKQEVDNHEKHRYVKSGITDKHNISRDAVNSHSKVDKKREIKKDLRKSKNYDTARGNKRKSETSESKDRKTELKSKNRKSNEKSSKSDQQRSRSKDKIEDEKNCSKNRPKTSQDTKPTYVKKITCKEGLFILLDRESIFTKICESVKIQCEDTDVENTKRESTDQRVNNPDYQEKARERQETEIPVEQSTTRSGSNNDKEKVPKQREQKENKLTAKCHNRDQEKEALGHKSAVEIVAKSSNQKIPSQTEKNQGTAKKPQISGSSAGTVEVYPSVITDINVNYAEKYTVLEKKDNKNEKNGKDKSSQTLAKIIGKRKSVEDDEIIETTPVQRKKKIKTEQFIIQKSLTSDFMRCTSDIKSISSTNRLESEPIVVQEPLEVQESDIPIKETMEPVSEVQKDIKNIEVIATENDIRLWNNEIPQKEIKPSGSALPDLLKSKVVILERAQEEIECISNTTPIECSLVVTEESTDKHINKMVILENENNKIIESLSAITLKNKALAITEENTKEEIGSSLESVDQKEEMKSSLSDCRPFSDSIEENSSESVLLCKDDDSVSNTQEQIFEPTKENKDISTIIHEVKTPKIEAKKEPLLMIPTRRHGRTRVLAPRRNQLLPSKTREIPVENKNVSSQSLTPESKISQEEPRDETIESGKLPELSSFSHTLFKVIKPQPEFQRIVPLVETLTKSHEYQFVEVPAKKENSDESVAQKIITKQVQFTTDGNKLPNIVLQEPFISNPRNTLGSSSELEQKRGREEDTFEEDGQLAKKRSVQHTAVSFEPTTLYHLQEAQLAQKHELDDKLAKPVIADSEATFTGVTKLNTQGNNVLADLDLKNDVSFFELSLVTEVTDSLTDSKENIDIGVPHHVKELDMVHVSLSGEDSVKSLKSSSGTQHKHELKTSQQIINETFAQYLGSSELTPEMQNPIASSPQLQQSTSQTIDLKSSSNVNQDVYEEVPHYYRNPSPPESINVNYISNLDFRNPSPPESTSLNSLPVLENLDPYSVGSDTQRPQILPDFVENKDVVNTLLGEARNVSHSNVGSTSSLPFTSGHIPTTIQGAEVRYQQIYCNNFQNNLVATTIHSSYSPGKQVYQNSNLSKLVDSSPVSFYNQQTISDSTVPSVSTSVCTGNTQCIQTLPEYIHGIKEDSFGEIKSEKESEFSPDKDHSDIIPRDVKFLEEYPCASPEQVLPSFNRNETFKSSPATSTISQHSENTSVSQLSENTRDTVDVNSVSSSFQKGDHTYPKDVLMNWHNEDKNELNQNPTGEYVKPITEYDMDELEFDLSLIDESSTPATGIFRHSSSIPTDGVWPFGVEPDNPNKILTPWDESSKVVVEPQPQDYSTYYPDFSCLNNALAGDITELSQGSESSDLERGNIDLTDWFNVSDPPEMLEMSLEESVTQDSIQENQDVSTVVEEVKNPDTEGQKKLSTPCKNTSSPLKSPRESIIGDKNVSNQPSVPTSKNPGVPSEAKPGSVQLPHLAPLSRVTTRSASKRDARESYVTPQSQSIHNLRVKSLGDLQNAATKGSENIEGANIVLANRIPGSVFTVNALLVKGNAAQQRTVTRSTHVVNSSSLGSSKGSNQLPRIFTRATALALPSDALKQQQVALTPVSTSNSSATSTNELACNSLPDDGCQQPRMITRIAAIGLPTDALKQKQITIGKQDLKGKTVRLQVVNPTFLKFVNTSAKNTVDSKTSAPPLVALQPENQSKVPLNDEPMEVNQTPDSEKNTANVTKKSSVVGKKSAAPKQDVKTNNKKPPIITSPENSLLFETRTMTRKVKEAISQTLKRSSVEENVHDAKKPCVSSLSSDPFDSLVKSPVNANFKSSGTKLDVKDNPKQDPRGHLTKSAPHQPSPKEAVPIGHPLKSLVHNTKDTLSPGHHQSKTSSYQHNLKEISLPAHRHNLRDVPPTGPQPKSAAYQHPTREGPRNSSHRQNSLEVPTPGNETKSGAYQLQSREGPPHSIPREVASAGHQSRSGSQQRFSRDTAPPGSRYDHGSGDVRGQTEKRHTAHSERSRSVGSRWGSKSPGFNGKERDKSSKYIPPDTRSKSDYCKINDSLATSPNGTLLFPELPHKIKSSPSDDPNGSNSGKSQHEPKHETQNGPEKRGTPIKPEEHKWRELMIPKVDPDWMLLPTQRLHASSGNSK